LQVNSSGVWLKTSEDNVEEWRALLKETLEHHNYSQIATTPTKDSYYKSVGEAMSRSFDGCVDGVESLFVNLFKNGHIRIETNLIDQLFESIIPHFEAKVNVKFDWAKGWEKYTYSPHVLQYLNDGRDGGYYQHPWWHKRRTDIAADMKKRDEVDEDSHSKIQVELEETRRQLLCAKEELENVSSTHAKMQEEIAEAKQKINNAKEELESVNLTHVQMEEELDDTTNKLTSATNELTSVTDSLSQMSVNVQNFNSSRKENLQCCFDQHQQLQHHFFQGFGPYHPGHHFGHLGHPGFHHPGFHPGFHPGMHSRYSREHSWVPDGKGGWKRRAFWEC